MIVREVLTHLPEISATLTAFSFLMAFSKSTRIDIGQRDHWTCQNEDCDDGTGQPKSYKNGWMVHASHINHDKEDPMYDEADSGEILCIAHHLLYHLAHIGSAEEIGLCEEANNFAVRKLQKTDERTVFWHKNKEKLPE